MLTINGLSVSAESAAIITDLSISFKPAHTIVITGANGSGKSTLASVLMGLSGYDIKGTITLDDDDITCWPIEKRAQAGMFLAYQHPIEVPGLSIKTFLQHAYRSCKGTLLSWEALDRKIEKSFELVGLPVEYALRNVHENFSGGQKKRFEIVQMLILEPRIVILDEIDSGLDAAGILMLIDMINLYKKNNPNAIFIIITHNAELSQRCHADVCLTMAHGRFVTS